MQQTRKSSAEIGSDSSLAAKPATAIRSERRSRLTERYQEQIFCTQVQRKQLSDRTIEFKVSGQVGKGEAIHLTHTLRSYTRKFSQCSRQAQDHRN